MLFDHEYATPLLIALLFALVPSTALAQDFDQDGLNDLTGAPVPGSQESNPFATGPIHVVSFEALGLPDPINSATWEFDESVQGPNGAKGYLWVGNLAPNAIYKIDTLAQAVVASHQLTDSPDGLAWDGTYLIVQSHARIHQVDPLTGLIVGSVLTPGIAYGICWQPALVPSPHQYTWSAILGDDVVFQNRYFTNTVFSALPVSNPIGALTDGKTLWTSSGPAYYQWDMATGAPLKTLYVGAVNNNPRDGTWDGHHLWDVTWQNGGFAWQWDLYAETGLYPVTVSLTPKAITASPGGSLVVGIGLKNHSQTVWNARIRLEIFDSSNAPVNDALIKKTLQPGEVSEFHWTRPVPASWSSGDTFKVRARLLAPTEESRAEDWAIISVL